MPRFLFDLDGTITREETLPLIARHFHVEAAIAELTRQTIRGEVPFAWSLRRRVGILGGLPVDEVARLLAGVGLHEGLVAFIKAHLSLCAIVTGNLDCWVAGLVARIGCPCYASRAIVERNRVKGLASILDKEAVVRGCQAKGQRVVFVGDGNNDAGAMRAADIAIAAGLTHPPARGALAVAGEALADEALLCRRLGQLCG